jgi:hypothetical protein
VRFPFLARIDSASRHPAHRRRPATRLRLEQLEDRSVPSISPLGPRFQVNTYTPGFQGNAQVAGDAQNNFTIVWQDSQLDSSGYGIYARRYDAAGAPLGNQFRVNAQVEGDQRDPAIAMNARGESVIAWVDHVFQGGYTWADSVHAQRYDAAGRPVGDNLTVFDSQVPNGIGGGPKVFLKESGEFAVFSLFASGATGWRVQWYDGQGQAASLFTTSLPSDSWGYYPGPVCIDAAGNFVVEYLRTRDYFVPDVGARSDREGYLRRLDAAGNQLGDDVQLFAYLGQEQDNGGGCTPLLTRTVDADLVAAWYDTAGSLVGERLDASGQASGAPFVLIDTAQGHGDGFRNSASLAALSDGNLVVAWFDSIRWESDPSFFRVVTPAGVPLTGTVPVDDDLYYHSVFAIAPDNAGGFVLAWNEFDNPLGSVTDPQVYAQRFGHTADVPPAAVVAESGGTTAVAEGGAPDTCTVALASRPTADVTLLLTPDAPLFVRPDVLTFTPANWDQPQTVTIWAGDDGVAQGDRIAAIALTLASADPRYNALPVAPMAVHVTDTTRATDVYFSAAAYRVDESSGSALITVNRASGGSTASIRYATADGSGRAGYNYTPASGTVAFAVGETTKTFAIAVLHNNAVDGDRTVRLSLSDPGGGATLGSPASAVLTITDMDMPAVPDSPYPAKLIDAARIFAHSREHYIDFVATAYRQLLKREPDLMGPAAWVGGMEAGLYTDERVEALFLGSVEYIASHGGTGQHWVIGMYRDLLGREPSAVEVQNWVAVLATGTPTTAVAYGFAASKEREMQRVVFNYQTYLGRPASAAEVDLWVNGFLTGLTNEDMVGGFIGAPEYYLNSQKGKGNRAHWIAWAYQDVLFRSASVGEAQNWLNFLS